MWKAHIMIRPKACQKGPGASCHQCNEQGETELLEASGALQMKLAKEKNTSTDSQYWGMEKEKVPSDALI